MQTKRLILRPWRKKDGEELYKYARSQGISTCRMATVHERGEHSEIIRTVLSASETYAVFLNRRGMLIEWIS